MKKSEFVLILTAALALPVILTLVQVALFAEPAGPDSGELYRQPPPHVVTFAFRD